MGDDDLKAKAARGLFWGGLSNGIQQLLSLVIGIFLARLLTQADYGMVGVLAVFSSIASALQEGGFISAINKKKEVCHRDYNAVFWFSTLCSVCVYAVLYMLAPLIASFYGEPQLVSLSRYLFIGFVISSLSVAPRACLFRNLKVRETSVISICALAVSGIVGVSMAALGFAYWGIATQTIVYVSVITVLNFRFARWHPTLELDFAPIRQMFGFSSKLIVTNVFTILNQNLFSNLLGRFYTVIEVGNFTQANKWNGMGHTLITNMVNGVAQPLFTKVEEDSARQLAVFRKLLRFTAFFSFPLLLGLGFVSEELIVIAITDKWIESAHILGILCLWGAFIPICTLFSNLLISRGHSDTYMWCTIALCVLQAAALCMTHPLGLDAMLWTFTAINVLWLFVWYCFVRREIGLALTDMFRDISPYLLLTVALIAACHLLLGSVGNVYASIALKIVFVGTLYVATLWLAGSVILRECIAFLMGRKEDGRP